MQKQPQAALHFYDPGAKIQLRVAPDLNCSPVRPMQGWDNTRPMSRECYQVTRRPAPLSKPGDVVFRCGGHQ
ncbi:MAG: hypothetical protein CM15mP55_3170 [Hyphomicrobiales bacterium]|nr:MAG: hypothetical protein CM15mP55_3170 [Hyphomicrobiales bacterium]